MKLLWLIPAFILVLFVKISLEQFDNTMREQDARALFREAQQSDDENKEATILLAIEKLSYSQLFDKKAIVNPSLIASYYATLADNLIDADDLNDAYNLIDTYKLIDADVDVIIEAYNLIDSEADELIDAYNLIDVYNLVNADDSIDADEQSYVDNRSDAVIQRDVDKPRAYYRQSEMYYLNALKIRPTKSVDWASLAMIKLDLQEVDEDYFQYITNAHRYGKHEPQTHIELVQVGAEMFSNEVVITSEFKSIFLHHLIFGITHQRSSLSILNGIIEDGITRDGFCSWIEKNKSAKKKLNCA